MADLAILGGGPAGYSAALEAAKYGAKPVLIESGRIGGTCLHVGCIPTKTLLSAAEVWSKAKRAGAYGLAGGFPAFALDQLHRRKHEVVELLAKNLEQEVRSKGIAIVQGEGTMTSPDRIEVRNHGTIEAKQVILATGAKTRLLPGIERVPGRVLTSDDLVTDAPWPRSIVIVGGGVIGVEFASLLSQAGAKVTILEALPGLLSGEDAELGRRLAAILTASGVTIKTNDPLAKLEVLPSGVRVTSSTSEVFEAEAALIAIGRGASFSGVDTTKLGIAATPKGFTMTPGQRTSLGTVFAAGDCTPGPQLAHMAAAQGRIAAASALGRELTLDLNTVPRCVYSIPEVAAVGLTEEQAKAMNMKVRKGKAIFRGNPRAQAAAEADGFIKVLVNEADGTLVGVHAIGPLVTELIAEAAVAVSLKIPAKRLLEVVHPHPTLGEAFQEACAQAA